WNATSRLWMLPLPVFQAFGVVTLQSHEITKRYPFFVRTPEQRVFTSSKLFWPQSSLFSALNVSGPLVLFADTKTGFITVGNFSPNQRAVFSSFPTTLLDEGLFRIVVRDIRGHVFSESFLDVRKANVIPLKIDSTSKTFLAAFSEAKRPLSGVTIRWQNQTRLTSADGVAKFSGFFNASVPFVYDTIDLFADAETFENAGQLSVYSMLAAILILIGAWIFARFRGKTFVVFRPPASHLRKKIPLDRAALEKLLGGHCQSFDQLRKKLCEKDPYLHVDPVSLQTALDDLVRSKRLNKKKEVYCL
ncbi:MAG TPA: hypothetical protein VI874_01005, partial [Candidatus Norongarragalinales archaeon]|nr:hypothetical protein [Candidatus Norongarragalinales archaeon]